MGIGGIIISSLVGLTGVIYFLCGMHIIRPTEKGVIETMGKYTKTTKNGFNFIFPIFQKIYVKNTTEEMTQIEPQEIITEDKLNAHVDLVIYYKVKKDDLSIQNSFYQVNDFKSQIITLAQTTARNVIGGMLFGDVNSQRNQLNQKLAEIMKKETETWGVDIVRVELKEIIPPEDVQISMNKVLKAENEKRAAIDTATALETTADGTRRAEIKKAEGEKQAAILRAEGNKQSQILDAEGKSKAYDLINKSFTGNAIKLKQLEVTQEALKGNSKIIIGKDTSDILKLLDLNGDKK